MGRYYHGDINGKFWFGIQKSEDADNFGVLGTQPSVLYYYFTSDDLMSVISGIQACYEELGDRYEIVTKIIKEDTSGFLVDRVRKHLNIPKEEARRLLELCARIELGEQIKKCIEDTGECQFEAEL